MLHLTLATGHIRRSPRSEVGDAIIAMLRPLVAAGGGPLPHPPGYRVQVTRVGRDALYTIWRGEIPVVTCGLAVDDAETVWRALAQFRGAGEATMPMERPWLAVALHDLTRPDEMAWLGDAERCLAWTLIETTEEKAT